MFSLPIQMHGKDWHYDGIAGQNIEWIKNKWTKNGYLGTYLGAVEEFLRPLGKYTFP